MGGSDLWSNMLPLEHGDALGYIRRMFHLSLRLITVGGQSAHLLYIVHKSARKTATLATLTFSHTVVIDHLADTLIQYYYPYIWRSA